ncbi:MAG: LOW QUALITY PROTEIN: uncharacterized protein KVP18_003158 [Porospora cf. gigantea A]|uniref:uncharacterized protein n=1 Tax=Porospora cf. gigantea A TaxID=2853593 RepID=UPI0035594CB8|nr:MAG: LOW QUALITY PROTEIN: hypothetical protein KVP18_003158 [Porospora cf. gigantea A]
MSDVEIPLDAWPRYHDGRPKIMKQRIVEGMIDGSQCVKNLSPQLLSEVQASLCHLNLRQLVVIRTHMAENCTAMRGVQPGLAAFGLKVEAIISERVITVMLSRDPTRKTHQRLIGASPHDLFKTPVNVDGPTSEPAPSWGSEFSVADRRQLGLSVLQTLGVTQLSVHDFDVDEWLFVSGHSTTAKVSFQAESDAELGPWGVYFQLSSLAAVRNVLQETSIVTVHPAEMNQGFVRPDAANKWVVLRLPPLGELSALEPPSMMSVVTQLNAAVKAREKRMQEVEAAGATVAVAPATQAAPEATAKCETRPRPKPRLWMLKSIASSTFEAFESALPPLTRFQSGDLDPVHERDSESTHKHPSIIGGPRRYSAGIVMRKGPTLAMTARTRHSSVPSASGMSTSRRAERVLSGMSTGRPDGLISATENLAEDDSPPSKEVPASHSPHSCSTQNRSNGAPKGVRRFFMRLRRPRTHF